MLRASFHLSRFALLAFFFGSALFADGLPAKPEPQPVVQSSVIQPAYTRFDKIELGVAVAAAAFDTVQTCHSLLANGDVEVVLPTQHCAPIALMLFGQVFAQEVVVQILRKTGHRNLSRALRLYSISMNAGGIASSKEHGSW